jgi:hypothetical protein
MRATPLHRSRIFLISVIAIVWMACGGRTQLTPAYQIGHLSSDAIVANDSGVRVVARTAAWPDPRVEFAKVIPIEMTFDNASRNNLRIQHYNVTLVTDDGERISAIPPAELPALEAEIDQPARLPVREMIERALAEGVLLPDERRTGFLYFERPDNVEQVDLRIDLVSAEDHNRFGMIRIPFFFD